MQSKDRNFYMSVFLQFCVIALAWLLPHAAQAGEWIDGFGFNSGADTNVLVLAVQPDNKVILGGSFTALGGVSRSHIGRLNPDGTVDAFNPGANDDVMTLAVQPDGKILVGGKFTILGDLPRSHIGRLNPDGTVDAFNPGASGLLVQALALQADGKILVGGNFSQLGGDNRVNLGRLNADGQIDGTFNPGPFTGPGGGGVFHWPCRTIAGFWLVAFSPMPLVQISLAWR